jgi:glycine/D-amino acid oxidase-like deaminating enzyme
VTTIALEDPTAAVAGDHPWGAVAPRWDELLRTPDLLVIGAGLAGLAVAATAVEAGLERVQVVDRGPIAGGATSRNAGALIPDVHAFVHTPAEAALGRRALDLHRDFPGRTGIPLRDLSWLQIVDAPPAQDRLRHSGGTWLPDREAVSEATSGYLRSERGVLVPGQAATDPIALATTLADLVPRVTTDVEVHRIDDRPQLRVTTSAGALTPGSVVVATGTVPRSWPSTTRRWVTGHLVLTSPTDLPRDLGAGSRIVVVPREDGRVIVGGTRDGQADGRIDPRVVAGIRDTFGTMAPSAAEASFERIWTGQRPVVDDDLPVIDQITDDVLVVGGLYHTGVLTSLAVAEAVVERLLRGSSPQSVRAFHRRPGGASGRR